MPRRTTYVAAALLAATQCAAFTAPITMGLKPPGARRRRWRRAGTAAAGAAVGLLTPLKAGARALVSNEVIKAAAEARAACKPGSIRDRIITLRPRGEEVATAVDRPWRRQALLAPAALLLNEDLRPGLVQATLRNVGQHEVFVRLLLETTPRAQPEAPDVSRIRR